MTTFFDTLPPALSQLAHAVGEAGGRAYLVGGSVRDHYMDLPLKDYDVEVYGLDMDALGAVLRSLGKVDAVGKAFGVYKWRPRRGGPRGMEIDVSIPRRDSQSGTKHTDIVVEGDPSMTTLEATTRRDLTINALMVDLHTGDTLDHHGGLDDLRAKRLAPVDETTFLEDPLRAVRAVQFAARLGFQATPQLQDLCRTAELDALPAERIQMEWIKLLLKGTQPSLGLTLARETHVLQRLFPEAAQLDATAIEAALDRFAAAPLRDEEPGWRLAVGLGVWLSGLTSTQVESTLDRLWLHKVGKYPLRKRLLLALAHQEDPIEQDTDLYWLADRAEVALTLTIRTLRVPDPQAAQALIRAEKLGVDRNKLPPLLSGADLRTQGVAPGPEMGSLLRRGYEEQLWGRISSREQAIAWLKQEV